MLPLRRLITAASLAVVTISVAAGFAAPTELSGRVLYVSPDGDDEATGLTSQAGLRTISACAAMAGAGDTCVVADGVYRESVFPNDGTTFTAAPGAKPVITGADVIEQWQPDVELSSAQGVPIFAAPAVLRRGYDATIDPGNDNIAANQVFSEGAMLPEAQYPEPEDVTLPTRVEASILPGSQRAGSLTEAGLPVFRSTDEMIIVFSGGWTTVTGVVTGQEETGELSYDLIGSDAANINPPQTGNRYFRLHGSPELLTQPGEWFYDADGQRLLVATDGSAPTAIEAKTRNYAFDLRGHKDVTISGFAIRASTIMTDEASSSITIERIDGQYLSHYQTQQLRPSELKSIYSSHKTDTGIVLRGTGNTLRDSTIRYSAGNGVFVSGTQQTVRNNLIEDVAYSGSYTSGISISPGASDILIERNTIARVARDGINMNYIVGAPRTLKNIRITGNDISAYGQLQHDLGAVYVCCDIDMSGSRVDHNVIHDATRRAGSELYVALYFDNGTFNVLADHNLTYNNGYGVGTNPYLTARPTRGEGLRFYNNTFYEPGGMSFFRTHGPGSAFQNNLALRGRAPGGPDVSHNLIDLTDVRFTWREAGDYTLAPGSAALDTGIAVPGVTESSDSPDLGAFESGAPWRAGCELPGCPAPGTLDTIGITSDSDTRQGQLGNPGWSLSAEALAAAGYSPGGEISTSLGALSAPWFTAGGSSAATAQGQLLRVSGKGSSLLLLHAAAFGTQTGTGQLIYADGSRVPFDLTSYAFDREPPADATVALTADHGNARNGQLHRPASLFISSIPLTAGKSLAGVILPAFGPGHGARTTSVLVFAADIVN
ncbi:right-handed parallel beta-helix repeat-containing protein [Microbacterium sp. NPDC056052]|uniref:right-handed parallel beta-helix repeat-containing protein n=1 Tax=Microbacterium sp. NPDC056052 TaxID=3345695 RepID=UPI0035DB8F6B